jgi:Fe-S cluster biogenesis protein NfuA
MAKVNATIDKFVRPALAGDGGGLEVLGMEGSTVFIRYQGACGGCPSAVTGTLFAIENLLKDQVDEEITVQAM